MCNIECVILRQSEKDEAERVVNSARSIVISAPKFITNLEFSSLFEAKKKRYFFCFETAFDREKLLLI